LTISATSSPEGVGQVGHDGLEQLVGDRVGAGELLAATARLAVDAHAHLHLVAAELEERRALRGRRARRVCRQVVIHLRSGQ
jgi:hypothetical protein